MTIKTLAASAALISTFSYGTTAFAGSDPFLGEIMITPYTFCPRGTISAEGQLLAIAQNTALFSLYGTNFGGDGRTTFGVPDLRGRTIMGIGSGPGLTPRSIGQKGGAETVTQVASQVGTHTHVGGLQTGHDATANQTAPKGNSFGNTSLNVYTDQAPNKDFMHVDTVTIQNNNSGAQPMNIMQPFTVLRYCVATDGLYPSRN